MNLNYLENNYSAFPLLGLLILGLTVFLFLRLIRFLIPHITSNRDLRKWAIQYFSLFELSVWVLFCLSQLPYLIHKNPFAAYALAIILFAMFIWIAWFGIRDIIAGFIFRSNKNLRKGELIEIDNHKGTIAGLQYRSLVLDTIEGKNINLPYSQIMNKPIIRISNSELKHSISFEVSTTKEKSTREIIEDIKTAILMHPRSSVNSKPIIDIVEEDKNGLRFSIKLFAIDKKYLTVIQEYIIDRYSK